MMSARGPANPAHALRRNQVLAALAAFGLAVGACGDAGGPDGDGSGGHVRVEVAPLNLEGIGFACYDLELFAIDTSNGGFNPELVWSRGDFWTNRADENGLFAGDDDTICSNLYGNGPGGDIFYVGSCDASNPTHVLRLVVDGLYRPLGSRLPEGDDWMNPCPPSNPCEFYANCVENADTPVVINLTILRSANQGFFDIAVRFNEIFCSAKVDCAYDLVDPKGEKYRSPILGLHNADGDPDYTAVIGFACTAGPGEKEATELFINPPRIECGGEPLFPMEMAHAMCVESPERSEMFTTFFFGQTTRSVFRAESWRPMDFVFQMYESHVWSYSDDNDNTWLRDIILPLVDQPTGDRYDFVFPVRQVAPDRVLGIACQTGSSPIAARARSVFPQCAVTRLATIRWVDGQWNELHVLPKLRDADFAEAHRYDPISRSIVAETVHRQPGDDIARMARFLVFDDSAPSGFKEAFAHDLPAGTRTRMDAFIDETAISWIQPDWDSPSPWSGPEQTFISELLSDGNARQVELREPNYDPRDVEFEDGSGETWRLDALHPDRGTYIISRGRAIMLASFNGGRQYLPVQVILGDDPDAPPLRLKLLELDRPYSTLASGWSLSVSNIGWLGRGFTYNWSDGSRRLFYSSPDPDLYSSFSKTWAIEPDGEWIDIQRVVESGPSRHHLVLGQTSDNSVVVGWLDPDEDTVSWFDEIPFPAGVQGIYPEDIRHHRDGVNIVYTTWGDRNGLMNVDILQVGSENPPYVADIHVLFGTTEIQSIEYQWGLKELVERDAYHFDYRTRDTREACTTVYDAFGVDSIRKEVALPQPIFYPKEAKADTRFREASLLGWNTLSPGTEYADIDGAESWSAFVFTQTEAFLDERNERIARAESAQYLYEVLPLAHPEGQGQFFSYLDDPKNPGYPENPPPEGFPLYQYATYYDEEELDCGGEPCNKMFFNVALGIRRELPNCMLAFEGTAAKPGLITEENGWSISGFIHPVIAARVNLTPEGSEFGVCGANPLGGEKSGVQAVYARPGGLDGREVVFPFAYRLHKEDGERVVLDDLLGGRWPWGFEWLDKQPENVDVKGFDGIRREYMEERFAPLTWLVSALDTEAEVPPRQIAQFAETWPDCEAGFIYVPDRFRCVAVCGDGVMRGDEACDDGNTANGDGCSSTCRVEFACPGSDVHVPVEFLCDGFADCPGVRPADELGERCFTCGDTFDRIFADQVCDGVFDCDNGRDEAFCGPGAD